MKRYSPELKESIIRKMMPPRNMSVSQLIKETGISDATLYNWRKEARSKGGIVPGDGKNPERWSSEAKFAVVLETAGMTEQELGEYCRAKGLYAEQITAWRKQCEKANQAGAKQVSTEQSKKDKKRIKALERELRKKDKALAETAALLVLRKKADAIWGEPEED
jgi:transposase